MQKDVPPQPLSSVCLPEFRKYKEDNTLRIAESFQRANYSSCSRPQLLLRSISLRMVYRTTFLKAQYSFVEIATEFMGWCTSVLHCPYYHAHVEHLEKVRWRRGRLPMLKLSDFQEQSRTTEYPRAWVPYFPVKGVSRCAFSMAYKALYLYDAVELIHLSSG